MDTAKTLSSTHHFTGRVIKVSVDEVELPNGRRTALEVVKHPGGAAAVAINATGQVCLLRQYRYAAHGWVWELPAGKLEPGEPPELTARRELVEEAGQQATHWTNLGISLSSPGVFTEIIHLYLATGLSPTATALEDSEVLEVHWVPFDEACARALNGEIIDSKTVIGLLRAREHLRSA
jgi:ADP-ribose pyrophosphatase